MKNLFLLLSLLFAFNVSAQETWNQCGTTVTQTPPPAYDSTFVLEAPSRSALQKGMANWVPAASGGSASYLVYTALLTQSGTDAPTAVVLENTLGGTVVWTRDDAGSYLGTLAAAFAANKTHVLAMGTGAGFGNLTATRQDNNTVFVGITGDDFSLSIEIRVFP